MVMWDTIIENIPFVLEEQMSFKLYEQAFWSNQDSVIAEGRFRITADLMRTRDLERDLAVPLYKMQSKEEMGT